MLHLLAPLGLVLLGLVVRGPSGARALTVHRPAPAAARPRRRWARGEAGQATAEYALVLLGAAAVALLVVSWATKTNLVGRLLDIVFNQLAARAR